LSVDVTISLAKVRDIFNIDSDLEVPYFSHKSEHVPSIDPNYYFDASTTLAIVAGFKHNLKVMLQGLHGSGKSTHIEQVAARLNWPLIRINLDGYISRSDLICKDAIIIKDGLQITQFKDGILPWALKQPMAIVFDEYDAARPDVMFVLQRILENQGKLTLIDTNSVIEPHQYFRIFATANTIGLGDNRGIYSGTNFINQGQMDRWNMVVSQQYLPLDKEVELVINKFPSYKEGEGKKLVIQMVELARLTRNGFAAEDISCLMSPRTILNMAENNLILGNIETAFRLSFLNKCDELEKPIIAEYYQRVFNQQLTEFIKESIS
jgi:cobaltochelatase CobS